MNCEILL